jgi:hypothetical protein
MHQNQTGGTGKFDRKVAIADPIQTVLIEPVKAQQLCRIDPINRKCGPRQRAAAQGRNIHPSQHISQPLPIPLDHFKIGQQMVGQAQGLSALEVGIARNQGFYMGFSLGEQRLLKLAQLGANLLNLVPQIKANIRAHLIIAGAGRVQLFGHIPQQLDQAMLHRKVNVFVLNGGIKLSLAIFSPDLL